MFTYPPAGQALLQGVLYRAIRKLEPMITHEIHPLFNQPADLYLKQVEQYKKKALDSWRSCQEDGFVSQKCHDLNCSLAKAKAKLIKNQGFYKFPVLVDSNENIISDYCLQNQWQKLNWLVKPKYRSAIGRTFIPTGINSRIQKKLGLKEIQIEALAMCDLRGSGKGFAGLYSVSVIHFPLKDKSKNLILR